MLSGKLISLIPVVDTVAVTVEKTNDKDHKIFMETIPFAAILDDGSSTIPTYVVQHGDGMFGSIDNLFYHENLDDLLKKMEDNEWRVIDIDHIDVVKHNYPGIKTREPRFLLKGK